MGRKQTEETKQKIRESWSKSHPPDSPETREKKSSSHIGVKRSEEFCLKNSQRTKGKKYALGSKRTPEQRIHLSNAAPKGDKNHFWRGGVSEENKKARQTVEAKLWKIAVFSRDGWKCRKCGTGGGFHAHHISNFHDHPEVRYEIENGITLCVDCHTLFHSEYGRHHNTPDQIVAFLYYNYPNGYALENPWFPKLSTVAMGA